MKLKAFKNLYMFCIGTLVTYNIINEKKNKKNLHCGIALFFISTREVSQLFRVILKPISHLMFSEQ